MLVSDLLRSCGPEPLSDEEKQMTRWAFITGAKVIDGTGAEPVEDCSVLVKDDRIAAVGPDVTADHVPSGESITRLDATGKTVMPGLIDGHCHTSFGAARTQEEQCMYTSVEIRTLRSASNVRRVLRAGVTSVSDPGGSYFIAVGLREGIKEGLVVGPRITCSGRFISTSNGIGSFYPSSVGVPDGSVGVEANTPDEMLQEVRFQIKNGVDHIKIGDTVYGDGEAFSPEEIALMADTAHRLGKRVTMHARGSNNVAAAVAAGLDWIMHGNTMTDEVIEDLAASKIPLCPTLALLANLADFGGVVGVPQNKRDTYQRLLDNSAETFHRAKKAGVTFISGTDTGFAATPYGDWHARELELLMTYAGLTPLEAIKAGTSDCAITMGPDHNGGSIEVGKDADLLIVDGDPIANIKVLQDKQNIETILLGGEIVDLDEIDVPLHPYDPSMLICPGEITWDAVFGDGEAGQLDIEGVSGDIAKELAMELRHLGESV